ncbi:hypothetical protein FVAG_03109 [Fusobacterium varium ATCC 27725]|jgi:hypothetical protein|nr:hypothetical protein FVAG_03109 [Fusobacterium varium ATCC 27725]VEH40892.1 Uncharacterised protein [Fusobacterium varium]
MKISKTLLERGVEYKNILINLMYKINRFNF